MSTEIENNRLIAEFMDGKIAMNIDGEDYYEFKGPAVFRVKSCDYDSSWNWLMPVVEKIETIPTSNKGLYALHIYLNKVQLNDNSKVIVETSGATKLQAVYGAVIKFIKHYNKISCKTKQ